MQNNMEKQEKEKRANLFQAELQAAKNSKSPIKALIFIADKYLNISPEAKAAAEKVIAKAKKEGTYPY